MKPLPFIAASILFALVPSTAAVAVERSADSRSSDDFANCEITLDDVVETAEAEEAEVTPENELQFTCMSNIITVQSVDSNGEPLSPGVAYNTATENAVVLPEQDDTLARQVQDELEVNLDPGVGDDEPITENSTAATPAPFLSKAKDAYRLNKSTRIVWGVKRGRKIVWSRSSKIELASIAGNIRKSTLWLTSDPVGNYQTAIEAQLVLKEHLRLKVDRDIDWGSIKQDTYSSRAKKFTHNFYNEKGAAKYYHYVHNVKMNDRKANRKFNIAGTVTMPRFQCYKTVVCKFPRGKAAPY